VQAPQRWTYDVALWQQLLPLDPDPSTSQPA
jgi:hypothetical protein